VGVSGSGVGVAGGIHPQTYMRISPGIVFRVGVSGSGVGVAGGIHP
jgi:hypothetical protein